MNAVPANDDSQMVAHAKLLTSLQAYPQGQSQTETPDSGTIFREEVQSCKADAAPGKTRCPDHLESHRAKARARRAKRVHNFVSLKDVKTRDQVSG